VDAQDGLLGCAQVRLHADGCRELASLVVIPAARGQGIARALIAQLLGGSPRPLYLRCEESLQPFYEKFGFGVVAVPADIPHSLRRSWQVMRWLKLHLLPGAPALLVMRLDA
jgi:GNAT superfamily N-acetyltransferase